MLFIILYVIIVKGAGLAIMTRKSLKIKTRTPFKADAFENVQATITCSGFNVRLAAIYCLHPKKKSGVSSNELFEEFAVFIDSLGGQCGHLLVLGDFNRHWAP